MNFGDRGPQVGIACVGLVERVKDWLVYDVILVGGFKHVLWSRIYRIDHKLLTKHHSRWLKPPTSDIFHDASGRS